MVGDDQMNVNADLKILLAILAATSSPPPAPRQCEMQMLQQGGP